MKHLITTLVLATTLSLGGVTNTQAGPIERACLKAERNGATRTLCDCIDDVARPIFSGSEMRRIAKFFADPHLSQELRQSDRGADERLWDRYKRWGLAVRRQCD